MRSYPRTAQSTTVRPSRSYSWTEMDEQMAREGQARINSMQSIGNARRNVTTKDSLRPGQSRVPSSGAGGGGEKLSLGQVMWATNYRNG